MAMVYYAAAVLLLVLKLCGLMYANCYPGDSQYTAIVQEMYKKVTSDEITGLRGYPFSLNRSQLCKLLVKNHNRGYLPESGQAYTNEQFLKQSVSESSCVNALTYTKGYDIPNEWEKWAGYLLGTWWSKDEDKSFNDGASFNHPHTKYDSGQLYGVQKVEFYSQWRNINCTHVNQTGATCRHRWNQSGKGVIALH